MIRQGLSIVDIESYLAVRPEIVEGFDRLTTKELWKGPEGYRLCHYRCLLVTHAVDDTRRLTTKELWKGPEGYRLPTATPQRLPQPLCHYRCLLVTHAVDDHA